MASVAPKLSSTFHSCPPSQLSKLPLNLLPFISTTSRNCKITNKLCISSTPQLGKKGNKNNALVVCQATQVSVEEDSGGSSVSDDGKNWIPVVPLAALPKGERRVIIQNDESILLLWYKNQVLAIENRSPAEGAYTEGLLNAKLTQVLLTLLNYFIRVCCLPFLIVLNFKINRVMQCHFRVLSV